MTNITTSYNSPNLLIIAACSFLAGACGALLAWKQQEQKQHRKKHLTDDGDLLLQEEEQQNDNQLQARSKYYSTSDSSSSIIYMDYNGTTPVSRTVVEAMMPYFMTHYGNPSSSHALANEPKRAMHQARCEILQHLLGVDVTNDKDAASSIIFTSCGTESDNMAIHLVLELHRARLAKEVLQQQANQDMVEIVSGVSSSMSSYSSSGEDDESANVGSSGISSTDAEITGPTFQRTNNNKIGKVDMLPHIVTSNVEHPAVEECLKTLEARGDCLVTYVAVQPNGCVRASDVIAAISEHTVLVTIMLANNESGALQPVQPVSEYVRKLRNERGQPIYMHTDAAQAAGKISVRLDDLGHPDMVSLVGHKLGAPKGVACLYVEHNMLRQVSGLLLPSHGIAMLGGAQEFGLRAGTPNVPYIVGMGRAAIEATEHMDLHAKHLEALRARLLTRLQLLLGPDNVLANGPDDANLCLPNTLSVGIRNVHSGDLLGKIGDKVAASAGATCHSAGSVSSVLRAMQVPMEFARGTLRLSLGPSLTNKDVEMAAAIIASEAKRQLEA